MQYIESEGNAYEIGFHHGKTLRVLIEAASLYKKNFNFHRVAEEKLAKILEEILEPVEETFPELIDEMKGIAEGAKISYYDILLLNFYPVINGAYLTTECSNIAFKRSDKGPILGRTYDSTELWRNFIHTVRPTSGYDFVHVGYAGSVWTGCSGINEHGLAMGESSVMGWKKLNKKSVDRLLTLRLILKRCRNVREAIEFLVKHDFVYPHGSNVVLVDDDGNAVIVEKMSNMQRVRWAENGVIYCSNFFVHKDMRQAMGGEDYMADRSQPGDPRISARPAPQYLEYICRYEYLKRMAGNLGEMATFNKMKEILRSHEEPGAICRNLTGFASIALPKDRAILITHGQPCRNPFIEYQI